MQPYFECSGITIYHGDCRDVLPSLDPVDSVVTDPPYGLEFMGKEWDKLGAHANARTRRASEIKSPSKGPYIRSGVNSYGKDTWAMQQWYLERFTAILAACKPGAICLAFGGTRTFHRLTCAIEDAGFEIRDCVMWLYGSGFPKSAAIDKHIDRMERDKWLNVGKALDNVAHKDILKVWRGYSSNAKSAKLRFAKSELAVGPPTQKGDSVPVSVLLAINPAKGNVNAIAAELGLSGAQPCAEENTSSVAVSAEATSEPLSGLVTIVPRSLENPKATQDTESSIAPGSAWDTPNGNREATIKVVEALTTWLGRSKSSSKADTVVLCVALTDALKLITLSQSRTFHRLDTSHQMAYASATTATITEFTAASLISFMVDTLRRKAIDKAAGAEREVYLRVPRTPRNMDSESKCAQADRATEFKYSNPATEAAKLWNGWGTALKPAWEPIVVAMKPLDGTFAENAIKHGVAGLNIDGCRVGIEAKDDIHAKNPHTVNQASNKVYGAFKAGSEYRIPLGRWPANVILDGSDEVLAGFPESKAGGPHRSTENEVRSTFGMRTVDTTMFYDSGSAARFFYTAKASAQDRGNRPAQSFPLLHQTTDAFVNTHPTVKPLALMEYLCKLTATPTGGTVLDPFMGSGTTLLAARMVGRPAIGIDNDEESCEIAATRLRNMVREMG